MRKSELVRHDLYDMKDMMEWEAGEEVFKDYYSVQLENTHSQRYKTKQL